MEKDSKREIAREREKTLITFSFDAEVVLVQEGREFGPLGLEYRGVLGIDSGCGVEATQDPPCNSPF